MSHLDDWAEHWSSTYGAHGANEGAGERAKLVGGRVREARESTIVELRRSLASLGTGSVVLRSLQSCRF